MCSRTALDHPALLYGSEEEFLRSMVPYVEGGIAGGEPVFVAARADNIAALRDALHGSSGGAELVDTERWHPHPANRLRAFHEYVSEQLEGGATAVRLAGEPVWPTGPPEFVREWQRYESILNAVLAPFPVTLVCLYDRRLDPAILAGARRTHRDVRSGGSPVPSDTYEPPEELVRRWSFPLEPPPPVARRLPRFEGLAAARGFLNAQALGAGLRRERATDLCIAANEVLTNALVHGGSVAAVHTWVEEERFICQIEDRGPGVDDPLAGYRPPPRTGLHGYGLWLARQLVDLMQIMPGPKGTAVRLHVIRR